MTMKIDWNVPKKDLREYQIDDLATLINNPRHLNRSEPATGKTGSAVTLIEYVWQYEHASTVFVNTSSIAAKNKAEILAHTRGLEPDQIWFFDPKKPPKSPPAVVMITADSLARHWDKLPAMMDKPIGLALCDEQHLYYSTHGSARTQAFYQFMKRVKVPRYVPLTGSIIRGRMDSAYPTIQLIEPSYYGDHTYFKMIHGVWDLETNKLIDWQNYERLELILNAHSINRTFTEVYGEENKLIIPVSIPIKFGKQEEAYRQFEREAFLELDAGDILTATEPGVFVTRCRQILSHPHTLVGLVKEGETTAKEDWLFDEILGGQYTCGMIFSPLVPEQQRIYQMMLDRGFRVALINGAVSMNDRAEINDRLERRELDYVIASPITAGVGFNWGHMEFAVFLGCDYMDDSFYQGYRRGIRGVRETPLRIYLARYLNTIEYRMWQIIERKSEIAHLVDPKREKLTGLSRV